MLKNIKICLIVSVLVCSLVSFCCSSSAMFSSIGFYSPTPIVLPFLQGDDITVEKFDMTLKLDSLLDNGKFNLLSQTIVLKSDSGNKSARLVVPVYMVLRGTPPEIKLNGTVLDADLRFAKDTLNTPKYINMSSAINYRYVSIEESLADLASEEEYDLKGVDCEADYTCYVFNVKAKYDGIVSFSIDRNNPPLIIDGGNDKSVGINKEYETDSYFNVACKAGITKTVKVLVIGGDTINYETSYVPDRPQESMSLQQFEESERQYELEVVKEAVQPKNMLWKYIHDYDGVDNYAEYRDELARIYIDTALENGTKIIDASGYWTYRDENPLLIGYVVEVPLEENVPQTLTISCPIWHGFKILDNNRSAQYTIPIFTESLKNNPGTLQPTITIANSFNMKRYCGTHNLVKISNKEYAVDYDPSDGNIVLGFTLPYRDSSNFKFMILRILFTFWPIIIIALISIVVIVLRWLARSKSSVSPSE